MADPQDSRLPARLRIIAPYDAILRLAGVATATTIAYILYDMVMRPLSAETMTFGVLCVLFLYDWLGPPKQEREYSYARNFDINPTIRRNAFFVFAYWYSFFLGLRATESTVAIGFIALTMIVTPLAIKIYRRTLSVGSLLETALFGLAILVAIFLMKLNLPTSRLHLGEAVVRLRELPLFPVFCMIVAVVADAGQEVARLSYTDKLASREEQIAANDEIFLKSVPVALTYAALLWVLELGSSASFADGHPLASFAWFSIWMLPLALLGTVVRVKLLAPMHSGEGLDYDAVPPWFAIRPLLYYLLAAFVTLLLGPMLKFVVEQVGLGGCSTDKCLVGGYDLQLNLMHELNLSFYIGLGIVSVIFVWKQYFFLRFGFSVFDPRRPRA